MCAHPRIKFCAELFIAVRWGSYSGYYREICGLDYLDHPILHLYVMDTYRTLGNASDTSLVLTEITDLRWAWFLERYGAPLVMGEVNANGRDGTHGDWGHESVSEGIYAAAVKVGGYSGV